MSGESYADDWGTEQKMEKWDTNTCQGMWEGLNNANQDEIQSYKALASLWYRNLIFYSRERRAPTVDDLPAEDNLIGKIPFAVQFCHPHWLPSLKTEEKLIALRDWFLRLDVRGEPVISENKFYDLISDKKGRDDLKTMLKAEIGELSTVDCNSIIKPFEVFKKFMEANHYSDPLKDTKYGTSTDEKRDDQQSADDAGSEEEEEDEDGEDEEDD